MKTFTIIVALDEENGIGKNGGLAWHISGDLKSFKTLTTAVKAPGMRNAVIMGRKTWDSLPEKFRPLPARLNVVLSKNADIDLPQGVLSFTGLDEALNDLVSDNTIDKVFVMGGAQVYAQAISHPACEGLHVTHVQGDFDCDVFFPEIPDIFEQKESSLPLNEGERSYYFAYYGRAL